MSEPNGIIVHMGQNQWRCIFCDRSDVSRSKEHVLRKKFQDLIPSQTEGSFTRDWGDFKDRGVERWTVPKSNFDMTINEVCRHCNQGWLNDLESRVEANVVALAHGNRPRLSVQEQGDLRFWMVKTALMKTAMDREWGYFIPLFHQMYESQTNPVGTEAQFGICEETAPNQYGRFSSMTFQLDEQDAVHSLVAFGVHRLAFQVTLTNYPDMAEFGRFILKSARKFAKGWNVLQADRRRPLTPSPHQLSAYRLYQQGAIIRDMFGHGLDVDDPNPRDYGWRGDFERPFRDPINPPRR